MDSEYCVYCKQEYSHGSGGREHVIPRSFGTYGTSTPVLNCVCSKCNSFFAKELDSILARDTIEGINRYLHGIRSRESRVQKNIKLYLDNSDNLSIFSGALVKGIDGRSNSLMEIESQFQVYNIVTNKYDIFALDQIDQLHLSDLLYGSTDERQYKVIANSKSEYEKVIATLHKNGISYTPKNFYDHTALTGFDPETHSVVSVQVEGEITPTAIRAVVKVLFNIAVYYLGYTETIKPCWDSIRNFVRYNSDSVEFYIDTDPFWRGQETYSYRFDNDSINARIENCIPGIVGIIQFYNLFTYYFLMTKSYYLNRGAEFAVRFTPDEPPQKGFKVNPVLLK